MKVTGYILFAIGFIVMVLSCCILAVDFWKIPLLIFMVGLVIFALGLFLVQKQIRQEYEKDVQSVIRHSDDEDKQRDTDNIEAMYKNLITKEIWQ